MGWFKLKKILGILAVLLFATASIITATPTGNEPAYIGGTAPTEFIRVYNTGVRTVDGIEYAVYKLDKFLEPTEYLGTITAQGYGYLTYKIKDLGQERNTNYFWQYSDSCQIGGCCYSEIGGKEYKWKLGN